MDDINHWIPAFAGMTDEGLNRPSFVRKQKIGQ